MSTTDTLRNMKSGGSELFTDYKKPSQLSSYISRVNKELGYKFITRAVEGGVYVTRIPNTAPAKPVAVTDATAAKCVDVSDFF